MEMGWIFVPMGKLTAEPLLGLQLAAAGEALLAQLSLPANHLHTLCRILRLFLTLRVLQIFGALLRPLLATGPFYYFRY